MLGKDKKNTSTTDSKAKLSTLIGEGVVFDGNLNAPEAIRIDGIVNGNCICEKQLTLGPEGQVNGNISAQGVTIYGKVDGDITVQGKLELLSSGKINGNITARSLVIDEDACFDGRCTMTHPSSDNDSSKTSASDSSKTGKEE